MEAQDHQGTMSERKGAEVLERQTPDVDAGTEPASGQEELLGNQPGMSSAGYAP